MSTELLPDALCARPGYGDLPWISENTSPLDRVRMAQVCGACPVFASCALESTTTETTAGFWAGRDRTETDLPEQGSLPLDLPGLEVAA